MNEEDIKLVESLIKEFKTYNDLDGIQDLSPYMKAIENIINRNKETGYRVYPFHASYFHERYVHR